MNQEECDVSAHITNSVVPYVFAAKGIFAGIGVVASVIGLKSEGISWLCHPNAKVLYAVHMFWSIYLPVTLVFTYAFESIRYLLPRDDPCDHLIPASLAIPVRLFSAYGVLVQSFTMCSFAIERAYATIVPIKYEKIKKPYIGIALGITMPFIAAVIDAKLVLMPVDWSKKYALTTLTTEETAEGYQSFLTFYLLLEIFTICVFTFTLFINRRRAKEIERCHKGLSCRYQIKENKSVIETLLPCFCCHFVLNLVLVLGLQMYYLFFEYDDAKYIINMEIWAQVHMYAVIMPLIIRRRLKKKRSRKIIDVNDTAAHFEHLRTMFHAWDK